MGCAGAILALGAPYFSVNARSLENSLMSALGQKQTLTLRSDDVRFTSKSRHEVTQTDVR
jgi:hypothetical protein